MKKIIINEEKCVGCGLCANACAQGAIELVDGKAKVVREDYCDGLGKCLPVCPVNAISFSDESGNIQTDKTESSKNIKNTEKVQPKKLGCGCSGTQSKFINHKNNKETYNDIEVNSQLNQWPVQIKLVPTNAPYFDNANLLVAADCTAYAYANFHNKFMKNKITIIGCPKLDDEDYSKKLTEIIKDNNIKSVTVVRMEVPCCGGIENAVKNALINSGKMIPWQVVVISTDGIVLE